MQTHFVLFLITIGIVFGRMTTQINLHRMLGADYPYFIRHMIPLWIGGLIVRTPSLERM
jgi:hypothetical protein